MNYDAILVTSFGGPEQPADVMPFLENVLRGKNVPRERMLEVAEHYYRFGGKSPINEQNRRLISLLEAELALHGPRSAGLLGKPQLAPDAPRYFAPDEGGWSGTRSGFCDLGLQPPTQAAGNTRRT